MDDTVKKIKLASFFSGCGGLDLGFKLAGFETVFANDIWKGCHTTFEKNHGIIMNKKSITDILPSDIPEVSGFIGGPPCQSWSLIGEMRGIKDARGKLFWTYINLIDKKQPSFFLAENVPGILSTKHIGEFHKIIKQFENIGYNVSYKILNSKNYNVPQERKRVFIVGYNKEKMGNKVFEFPEPSDQLLSLRDAIGDLPPAKIANEKNHTVDQVFNQEYAHGGFSSLYMSRNQVRSWNEQSYTILASARHASQHPNAPKMTRINKNLFEFKRGYEHLYRRLSVRECARIQTFPDNFIFYYKCINDGYKMIGNAVPVNLASAVAKKILADIAGENND